MSSTRVILRKEVSFFSRPPGEIEEELFYRGNFLRRKVQLHHSLSSLPGRVVFFKNSDTSFGAWRQCA